MWSITETRSSCGKQNFWKHVVVVQRGFVETQPRLRVGKTKSSFSVMNILCFWMKIVDYIIENRSESFCLEIEDREAQKDPLRQLEDKHFFK
jgi:hypothetical protein